MKWTPKRRPDRPNRTQALAAFNAQRPLDPDAKTAPKRKRRKMMEDTLDGIGGTDGTKPK